ncbi:extracellular solute-binding protein [Vibrio sp. SCSIO 43132]|nr:extracellular solute-binding protein [Vibrio sp. SCSIO 43132]
MEEAASRYKNIDPNVTINVVSYSKLDLEQKLHTMLAAGVDRGLPEIVLVEDYNAQLYLSAYPGSFEPLTNSIDVNKFSPYKSLLVSKKDELYGVPFDSGVTGLFYRKDLLEQAGFTEKDLQNITWKRYIEIGRQVKAKTGVAMLSVDPEDLGLVNIMMQSAGVWFTNADGSLNIAGNKALITAMENFKQLSGRDVSRPISGWGGLVSGINQGLAATAVKGVWFVPAVTSEKSQHGKWAIAPTPRLSVDGAVNASNLGGSSWFVLNESTNKKVAIDFLQKIFASDLDFYSQMLVERGAVSTYIPASESEGYNKSISYFSGQKIYRDFSGWQLEVPDVDYGSYSYEITDALKSVMPDIFNGRPIEDALKQVEKQLEFQLQ